jgi:hypothetical protein
MIASVVARAHRLDPRSITYRVALAILYAELHRVEEAYALVQPVRVDRLTCRHCLTKLAGVFQSVGDAQGAQRCQERLRGLPDDHEDQRGRPACGPC